MKRFVTALITVAMVMAVTADRKNSVNRRLKRVPQPTSETTVPFDTVAAEGLVRFSGYEKTLRSNRETMFVTNLSEREIGGVWFGISYLDTSGRLLHKASHRRHVSIPPGETRRIDIPSWDKQCTFYYTGSPRPRISAIPYDITITPDTLLLTR